MFAFNVLMWVSRIWRSVLSPVFLDAGHKYRTYKTTRFDLAWQVTPSLNIYKIKTSLFVCVQNQRNHNWFYLKNSRYYKKILQ